MTRMIDQIRASKLPSNMMQFAARGALQVSPAENIEILVYLARHNKIFGDLAKMTLAGWDEKSCLLVAADPQAPREVLEYFISPDNVRPKLLPSLLENPSVPEALIAKLAVSAMRDTIQAMVESPRVRSMPAVINVLRANPYLKKEEAAELLQGPKPADVPVAAEPVTTSPAAEAAPNPVPAPSPEAVHVPEASVQCSSGALNDLPNDPEHETAVSAYMTEHDKEIAEEAHKPFQAIGGIAELLSHDESTEAPPTESAAPASTSPAAEAPAATAVRPAIVPKKPLETKRLNTVQKINGLDVKGRIQLALKGNKEERSILIRDGTKVVALAVLEAPKLADSEVEKFASQKNVLEAVLRQIPLKRRFMKNYIVVRNLVANPRTPLDLSLGLMKNLQATDLKNLSANKEVSEMIRKLALKMYKQKMEAVNKK